MNLLSVSSAIISKQNTFYCVLLFCECNRHRIKKVPFIKKKKKITIKKFIKKRTHNNT